MNDKLDFQTGVKDSLPTVFGYIGIGIAFGIICHAAGLSVLAVALMCLFVYAGSAQFIIASMMFTQSPVLSIALSVFLVNSRFILLSMNMAPHLRNFSTAQNIWIGSLLTDESFALATNKLTYTKNKLSFEWFNAVNILPYIFWTVAAVIGSLLGEFISNPEKLGLDFAIVAMFIGLLYLQFYNDKTKSVANKSFIVLVTLGLVYFGMIFIPANLLIIVVTVIACGIGVLSKNVFK